MNGIDITLRPENLADVFADISAHDLKWLIRDALASYAIARGADANATTARRARCAGKLQSIIASIALDVTRCPMCGTPVDAEDTHCSPACAVEADADNAND